jgi:hypothetical protein
MKDILDVPEIVDLHIENLLEPGVKLSPASILNIQTEHFMNVLEKAIAARRGQMIFIHGIGNGVLKNNIRTRLAKHPDVEQFDDADPKLFGYGATVVYIKMR